MATKRTSTSSENGEPAKKKGFWALGLLDSIKDPSLQHFTDDEVVVIKDKYPKARHHYLVCPRLKINNLKSLKPEHLPLLNHMHDVGKRIIKESIGETGLQYQLGYHAIPSMSHLHLHAISRDFDSPCLKNKKHWNSFTTDYFVDSMELINELEENKCVDTSGRKGEELLKLPLRCHVCKAPFSNMPKLKGHIVSHIKK